MGLDEFVQGNSNVNNQEDKNEYTGLGLEDNSPTPSRQAFTDSPGVTPRSITYHIKTVNARWLRDYSLRRFDTGELVMYGYNCNTTRTKKTVMVFTTIQSIVDSFNTDQAITETKSILVVPWNIKDSEPLDDPVEITPDERWEDDLVEAIESQAEALDDYETP